MRSWSELVRAGRQRRFDRFVERLRRPAGRPLRLLDVGGTSVYWAEIDWRQLQPVEIVLFNVGLQPVAAPFQSVAGDARDLSRYGDQTFDVVYSNSVIGHVGTLDDQARMAREIQRVGPHLRSPDAELLVSNRLAHAGAGLSLSARQRAGVVLSTYASRPVWQSLEPAGFLAFGHSRPEHESIGATASLSRRHTTSRAGDGICQIVRRRRIRIDRSARIRSAEGTCEGARGSHSRSLPRYRRHRVVNAGGLAFLVVVAPLMLVLSRRLALLPLLMAALYTTRGPVVALGPANLSVLRVVVIVGLARTLVRGNGSGTG